MGEPYCDRADQLNRILPYLLEGEELFAVYDCKGGGTGFVGITDRRIIFYDQAFLTNRKAMVSVPYHQVVAVGAWDEGIVFRTSTLTLVTAAGNYTFVFRGADKAQKAYRYIMTQILSQAHPQLPG